MTSTAALEVNESRQPALPGSRTVLALYGLAGFGAFLTLQAGEQSQRLLTGGAASAFTLAGLAHWLGFALGAMAAAELARHGAIGRPLAVFGALQTAAGVLALVRMPPAEEGWRALAAGLILGASFALIAGLADGKWLLVYTAGLAGALAAAVAAPGAILPVLGWGGARWIAGALGLGTGGLALWRREARQTGGPVQRAPLDEAVRGLLAEALAAGAVLFLLEIVWTHLSAATVYGGWRVRIACLAGLTGGAVLARLNARAGQWIRPAWLLECAAVLLLIQVELWDRVAGFAAILLVAPPAAVLGSIFPRLLVNSQCRAKGNAYLAGYLPAAYALGSLLGGVAGMWVLGPPIGAEIVLKGMVAGLAIAAAIGMRREPFSRRQLAGAAMIGAAMLAAMVGRWWDWQRLTAVPARAGRAVGARYLPPAFVFRHEDLEGGFTTVVEQTIVEGETARTVRTLFADGRRVGDDRAADSGWSAAASRFVAGRGRALLVGLGTGREAAELKHQGYGEIAIAEFAPGVVEAAARGFSVYNERILADPAVRLHLKTGRGLLLRDGTTYDLIANAGGADRATREFYELVRAHLRPGGVYAEPLTAGQATVEGTRNFGLAVSRAGWQEVSGEPMASELESAVATAASVFAHSRVWQGVLLAADHTLPGGANTVAPARAAIRSDDDWRR